jgi:hypothetical protein
MDVTVEWLFEQGEEAEYVTLECEMDVDRGCDYGVPGSPVWDEYSIANITCDNVEAQAKARELWRTDAKFADWLEKTAKNKARDL